MKAIYKNIALAALALCAVACTQEEDFASSYLNDPDAVRITAQVASGNVTGGFTRSNPLGTTEAEQKAFNSDDAIAVTAGNQDAVTYTLNGTTWTPEAGKYLKWETNSMNFTAWYPVGEGTDANTFTVPTSYADVNAMAATDYMVYSGTQNKTSGNGVTLTMNRKMARIVITPVLNDEFATGYSITGIKVHANTSGYANGEPQTGDIQVLALKQGNAYYALLAPTTAADATFLTVTVTDGTNSQNLTVKGIPATEAGKSYDYTLTVGKDKATIGNVTVADWGTSVTIPGGEAVEIPYLTFTVGGNQSQSLVLNVMGELDSSIQYSANGGDWTNFETDGVVDEYGMSTTTPVSFTNNLRIRGQSASGTVTTNTGFMISFADDNTPVTCSGDIRTLVDYTNYETTSTANACFFGLFMNCLALDDASGLKLISNNNKMAASCYESMFAGCEKLTSAPELPATTLAESCYKGMFAGCSNLTTAPALPAEKLANFCYVDMFNSCKSLTSAPALPATTLAQSCYVEMFAGCSNLTTAPAQLPATTLANNCYTNMFVNCSKLESAPVLPAEALVTGCYWQMFEGCTKLNRVTMLATNISAQGCLTNWLKDVAATGTFTKAAGMETLLEGESGIPSGWTVENY